MPRNMPARIITSPTFGREATRQELHVVTARRELENGLVATALQAHFNKESAMIDAEATAAAVKATLESELGVLSFGIEAANGSAAAAKLVGDRIEWLSRANSQNLSRRVGA